MLLVLLAGCGSPSYYPDASRYSFDTSVASVPCGEDWGGDPVELRATSVSTISLLLVEYDASCLRLTHGVLSPEVTAVPTHAGAVFVAETTDGVAYTWTQIPAGQPSFLWEVR